MSKQEEDDISEILPLRVLIEEMRNNDPKQRIQPIKNISTVALCLGYEHSRALLIPFIKELFDEEEEELTLALIQTIPGLVNFIGGPAYAHLLLDIVFSQLCKYEEGEIRENLLTAMKKLLGNMDLRKNEKLLMDMLNRILDEGQSDLKSKETVLHIIPELFIAMSSEIQQELTGIFQQFATDSSPMVRKQVAKYLKDLIKLIPIAPENELKDLFVKLLSDDNELVRQHLLESLIPLYQVTSSKDEFLQFLTKIGEDASPRVRGSLIDNFAELCSNIEYDPIIKFNIVPFIIKYVKDNETELKNKLLMKIHIIFQGMPIQDFEESFIPLLETLVTDKNIYVKANVGEALLNLLNESNNLKNLEKILDKFLQENDNETRQKFLMKIKNFEKIRQSLSDSVVQILIKSVHLIFQNKKWRIRTSALQILVKIIKETNIQMEDLCDNTLIDIFKEALIDKVNAVRQEALLSLQQLCSQVGGVYFESQVLNSLTDIMENKNYLIRISYPLLIKKCIEYFSDIFINQGLKIKLQRLVEDKVANIRLVGLEIIQLIIKANRSSSYQGMIDLLCQDDDVQIQQMAQSLQTEIMQNQQL